MRTTRLAALLASGIGAGLTAGVAGASQLGVPGAGGAPPSGWFMLAAADAVDPARSQALGDVAHRTTLYVEVPTRGLTVELYDPGLFDPARPGPQLDLNLGDAPPLQAGEIRYVLRDPTGVVRADVTYGADTVATDRQIVMLFDDRNAVEGIWQLDASLVDGLPEEQDVAVFGVRVAGRQVFTYNLTAGQANQGGAAIAEPLSAFPWLVQASAGADAAGPTCGASFVSYDLDATLDLGGAPVPPPSTDVRTRRGYAFPAGEFPPSGDARWTQTAMNGLPYGFLDSNDQGTWEWAFTDLTVPEDVFGAVAPPLDLNAFSIQVLDLGAPPRDTLNWPSVPPFGDSNPRRIYLPEDDGSAPARAWLGHSAEITAGFPQVAQGETSTLDVTIELGNPHAFDLTGVTGESSVTPDPQVGDPVLVGSTGGLVASLTGRRLTFTGDVPAGTIATVTYRVVVTPAALGREFLTGDDGSFVSATAPTRATYDTPYLPSLGFRQETLGPVCEIEYESVLPGCVATARLAAERLRACPGTDIGLDASASEVVNCPGGIATYQWSVNGAVAHPFPAASAVTVTPIFDDTWSVEVACSTDLACSDAAEVTFDLYPGVDVAVTADPQTLCAGAGTLLTAVAGGGTPPYANGRWSTSPPGEAGDGSAQASFVADPNASVTYTYTIEDALGCVGSASVDVTVREPQPVLTPGALEICPGESASLDAGAGWEGYSWTTSPNDPAVEGADTQVVTVSQPGTTYTVIVTDADGCAGSASLLLGSSADPVPGPVASLLASRAEPDVVLRWSATTDDVAGYEVVFLECPTRDWRDSCGGRVPDVATMAAQPAIGPMVPEGTETATHGGAFDLGEIVFYLVRALSPCSRTPGPLR